MSYLLVSQLLVTSRQNQVNAPIVTYKVLHYHLKVLKLIFYNALIKLPSSRKDAQSFFALKTRNPNVKLRCGETEEMALTVVKVKPLWFARH